LFRSILEQSGLLDWGGTFDEPRIGSWAPDEADDDDLDDGSVFDTTGLGVVNIVERSVL